MARYFKEIGVDAIWLNPINKSPMVDFGYDVSDFSSIEPMYGTMEDFDEMVATLKALGIKVVLDFVPNHTSDQHIWFQASINTSHPFHEDFKDFYVWRPANGTTSEGKPIPPNNWISVFGGSSWQWSDESKMFYLHDFAKQQPDLNYRNPNVVSNMTAIMQFWLDKGVDGFRTDAAKFIYENASFPNQPPVPGTDGTTYDTLQHIYDHNQPENFQLLRYWTDVVHQRTTQDGIERAIFNEVYDTLNFEVEYYGTKNRTMGVAFNFNLLTGGSLITRPSDLKHLIDEWMDAMPKESVPNWVVGNHDNKRVSNRYGPEMVDAVNMLIGVLPGIMCVYYGEEIGMEDTFILWNQTRDPWALLLGPDHYLEESRDPARTPMQWDNSTSGGFSVNKTTWLPVNPNYWWLNVQAQRASPNSHLKVFQAIANTRKDPVLQRGDLKVIVPDSDTLLTIRSYNGSSFALLINMGSDIITHTSQDLFGPNGIDMDMTVAVASCNSGYTTGMNLRKGFLSVTVRPKAAILLRSATSLPQSSSGTQTIVSTLLILCTVLVSSLVSH